MVAGGTYFRAVFWRRYWKGGLPVRMSLSFLLEHAEGVGAVFFVAALRAKRSLFRRGCPDWSGAASPRCAQLRSGRNLAPAVRRPKLRSIPISFLLFGVVLACCRLWLAGNGVVAPGCGHPVPFSAFFCCRITQPLALRFRVEGASCPPYRLWSACDGRTRPSRPAQYEACFRPPQLVV